MDRMNKLGISKGGPLVLAAAFLMATGAANAQAPDPAAADAARMLAEEAGLGTLADVEVPEVPGLDAIVTNPDALVQLGKALFWDMQVGSDGQACASCHFAAGADPRAKNQINPGTNHVDPDTSTGDVAFGNNPDTDDIEFPGFGPNYTLTEDDFPFHELADGEDRNSTVERDTNDVASSAGVFNAEFLRVNGGKPGDVGISIMDEVFNVGGVNTRRVEPRNTPTMINAVFTHSNFWDGRAHNSFNGVSTFGPLHEGAEILVRNDMDDLVPTEIEFENSSLASQAVGPPESNLEMSFNGRRLALIGKKLVDRRPLRQQLVHPEDSVLGPLASTTLNSAGMVTGPKGLDTTYATLIMSAFDPAYWSSANLSEPDGTGGWAAYDGPAEHGFTQMQVNFSLFFGLAVQAYESTLIADRTPFDAFMEGDNTALDTEQLVGLELFVGAANCAACHGGPELTDAAFTNLSEEEDGEAAVAAALEEEDELELIEIEETPALVDGEFVIVEDTTLLDNGFSNIGVRPTAEDVGRGGEIAGIPLSFVRQALAGYEFAPELECGEASQDPCPERESVDGAFKVPGLRNVELTGPYFHNGGTLTLEQVVEFYDRQGDFSEPNLAFLDRQMARIDIDEGDEEPLVEFLLALTDERVRNEQAPFDHPQLFVSNGHPGDQDFIGCVEDDFRACDDILEVPALGADGRPAAGLPPLETFLGVEHLDDDDEEEGGV